MGIELHTVDGGNVQAINDGRFYSELTGAIGGIVLGADCAASGGLVVSVSSGWGIASGRLFTITAENFTVTPSSSGTKKGRLFVRIDLTNADEPIKVMSIAETSLPRLTKQDLSSGGTIYEIELANYDITTLAVSNLVSNEKIGLTMAKANDVYTKSEVDASLGEKANASDVMPKSGGAFTGWTFFTSGIAALFQTNNGGLKIVGDSDSEYAFIQVTKQDGTWITDILKINTVTGAIEGSKLMPTSGGTFTGNVLAYSTNRSGECLRNITVRDTAGTTDQSTNFIQFNRK